MMRLDTEYEYKINTAKYLRCRLLITQPIKTWILGLIFGHLITIAIYLFNRFIYIRFSKTEVLSSQASCIVLMIGGFRPWNKMLTKQCQALQIYLIRKIIWRLTLKSHSLKSRRKYIKRGFPAFTVSISDACRTRYIGSCIGRSKIPWSICRLQQLLSMIKDTRISPIIENDLRESAKLISAYIMTD